MITIQALLNQRDPVHPEQGPDEVYLGNYAMLDVAEIGWETARMGQLPHNEDGERMPCGIDGFFAVFIKRSELLNPWGDKGSRAGLSTTTN